MRDDFKRASADLETRFKKGAKGALARMILKSAAAGRALPTWAADAYIEAFAAMISGKSGSWDDVLGLPYSKGRHLASVRLELRAHEAYCRVRDISRDEGVPIDSVLFDRVGRATGIGGKTTIARLYSRVKRDLG